MRSCFCEPASASFDEFEFVKPSPLFRPPLAATHELNAIDQAASDPFAISFPSDISLPVINVDRPRPAVQAKAAPVPQLECEDVGSRTDFQNHAVPTRTMDRTCRDKKVVMFPSREPVDVILHTERRAGNVLT